MISNKTFGILAALLIVAGSELPAHADSVVLDGPGFKVQNKTGWFGHKSTSYTDALGNKIERNHGWFGRQTTHTKVFGSEATVTNNHNVSVSGPNGTPLITHHHTWFHGEETHVNGDNIFHSLKGMFTQPNQPVASP